jgi:mevalonate kinase
MKLQQASACGKCILLGEHSILEGGSALALPLKMLKIEISFEAKKENSLTVNFPLQDKDEKLFWSLLREDFSEFNTIGAYNIESSLPIGAGLGSSAALCVALNRLFRKNIYSKELIEKSWLSEFRFHGKSSGIDPTTIVKEKALHFYKPNEFSEIIFPSDFNSKFIFVLFDSKIRRNTHKIIQQSQSLKERDPLLWKETISQLQLLALEAKAALQNNKIQSLGLLMNKAHSLLGELGASNEELNALQYQIINQGAFGAKLTGAGRGGFLLALFELKTWNALKSRKSSEFGSFFELIL